MQRTSDNREEYNAYYREYMKRWYIKRKLDAIAYKGGKCQKCGYDKCYAALKFHHRDPSTKEFEWSKMRVRSWATILAELDKCDLLCGNCHDEEHFDPQLSVGSLEWLAEHRRPPRRLIRANCKHCGKQFSRKPSHGDRMQYCSRDCSRNAQLRAEYPDDEELIKLVDLHGRVKVGSIFGVSDRAIQKKYALAKHRLHGTELPRRLRKQPAIRRAVKQQRTGRCERCGNEFQQKKGRTARFCGNECRRWAACKVQYPSDAEFVRLVDATRNYSVLATHFGVDRKVISKRYQRILAHNERHG